MRPFTIELGISPRQLAMECLLLHLPRNCELVQFGFARAKAYSGVVSPRFNWRIAVRFPAQTRVIRGWTYERAYEDAMEAAGTVVGTLRALPLWSISDNDRSGGSWHIDALEAV